MGAVVEEVKEPVAEPTAEQAEADNDALFDAGFTGEEPKPSVEVETPVTEPAPEVVEPEYAQLTKQEKEDLIAARKVLTDLQTKIDASFGSFGGKLGALEQKIAKAMTPGGELLSLSDEDFAELKREYPELAGSLKSDLTKIFGRLKGMGKSDFDEGKVKALITDTTAPLIQENRELALDVMDTWREDWLETVNSNPFIAWLGTQPEDYRQTIQATWKPVVMKKAILAFEQATKKPEPKPVPKAEVLDPQKTRLKAAVQPKGDGQGAGKTSGALSDDEAFDQGFQSRK